jgi:large subunit ribosomal protein L22
MATQTAKLNYLKIAPRKVRLLANTLKGLSIQEAEAQLLLRVQRSARPLLKLIRSAVANARNKKMDVNKLVVSSIVVNPGPILKRFLPRAQGRATPIHKKMSHVVLVLSETEQKQTERFKIQPPVKKEKAKKEKVKPKIEEVKKEKPKEKVGFFRRLFRRKSV